MVDCGWKPRGNLFRAAVLDEAVGKPVGGVDLSITQRVSEGDLLMKNFAM
jgi:hypothetical protein